MDYYTTLIHGNMNYRYLFDNEYVLNAMRYLQDTRSLEGLPSELIDMIAEHLPKEDLLTLRLLGNRSISHAIDHVFTEVYFSHRRCRTTVASVVHLETLTCTRFAKRIHSLEICSVFNCQLPQSMRYGLGIQTTQAPCLVAVLSVSEIAMTFSGIFRRMPNLRSFTLRAPAGLDGMCDLLVTEQPPMHAAPGTIPDLRFHLPYELPYYPEHSHIICTHSMTRLMCALLFNIRSVGQLLEKFQILGFADSRWQSKLTGSPRFLEEVRKLFALQGLTSLDLQLEMFTFGTNRAMISLVKLIENNANLRSLKLSVGPTSIARYQTRSENWASLLKLLGSSPPFRLHSLELDGLVTSTTAPTLARIIDVHSFSIRRLVLKHTNFHFPNTLRNFFTACANSSLHYYMSKDFFFHEIRMLLSSYLDLHVVEDEELHKDIEDLDDDSSHCYLDDTTCQGWVEVNWDRGVYAPSTLVYDNEDGQHSEGYMYKAFMNAVSMINDGAIIDF